jgi:hypothetical protein
LFGVYVDFIATTSIVSAAKSTVRSAILNDPMLYVKLATDQPSCFGCSLSSAMRASNTASALGRPPGNGGNSFRSRATFAVARRR